MTAAVTPLREGDPSRLGSYRLTGLLGEGGQGAVYLGEDGEGRRVAVKLLHARFSGDPKARARFAAEVATAKRVSAFCTARVLDSDVEGDRPYIVSEYIEGPSLSEVLAAGGPLRGAELDRLAIGTMTALAAIHQAGVVHRDFKPANVLLAPDGPRVIDFGIARALDATGTMSSTAVGTPAYMAPEQISGAQVGPAADVFAWGATMVYAACGRPAFGQDSIPAVMHRILNLPPDLGDLGEPLREVVADCLSKDPALRPASPHVLAHLLALAGSPPQPGAGQPEGDGGDAPETAILTRGAATAATETTRLRAPAAPSPPGAAPPPGPQAGRPVPAPGLPPVPGTPWPNQATGPNQATAPGGHGAPTWPGGPSLPGSGTWPGGPGGGPGGTGPGGGTGNGPGGPGRPGIGVLASAGGAALVALVLVGTVLVVQLNRDNGDPDPRTTGRIGGTFRMAALSPASPELDPAHARDRTGKFIVKQLFTGLVETDSRGAVRNRLAADVHPNPSCTQWKIGIKRGTTFSDGTPVDAEAFARGWARSAAVKDGPAAYLMNDIAGYREVASGEADELSGVTVVSGGQLSVQLTSPNCEFPARLAEPVFMPVPEPAGDADDAAYNSRPIGNGPFTLDQYQENRRVTLVRNDSWAFGKTKLDRVVVELGDDPARGRASYAGGLVDWHVLTSDDVSTAPRNERVTRLGPYTRMLVPVMARGPMKSKGAREAVSLALDREKLSRLFGDVHAPARGIVSASIPGFGERGRCASCDGPDPEKAKAVARQAGLEPGTEVKLHFTESPINQRIAEAVRTELERTLALKIEMSVTPPARFPEFRDALASKDASGLAVFAYGPDYPGAYTMLWPLLGSENVATDDNGRYNLSGWKNREFDTLISNAVKTSGEAGRNRLFGEAEKLALDDLALIPLLEEGYTAVAKTDKYVRLEMDYDGDPTVATAALK